MNKKFKALTTETKTSYTHNPYKSVVQQYIDTCYHNKKLIVETCSNFPKEYVPVTGRKGEANE